MGRANRYLHLRMPGDEVGGASRSGLAAQITRGVDGTCGTNSGGGLSVDTNMEKMESRFGYVKHAASHQVQHANAINQNKLALILTK